MGITGVPLHGWTLDTFGSIAVTCFMFCQASEGVTDPSDALQTIR